MGGSREQRQEAKRREGRLNVALAYLGIAASLGLGAYAMLDPHPNFLIGSGLLFLTFAFLLAGLWKLTAAHWLQFLFVAGGVSLFVFLEHAFHYKQQAAIVESVQKDLILTLSPSPTGKPLKASFEVHNNSDYRIPTKTITCAFNEVCTTTFACMERSLGHIEGNENVPLYAHGDAQSDQCAAMVDMGSPIGCADITVFVNYTLADIPELRDAKQWRFATSLEGDSLVWHQQPIGAPVNAYCKGF